MKRQTFAEYEEMNKTATDVEQAGREFYKTNNNFTDAVNEARKRYNSAWMQDVFVMGRNLEFWGR